MSPTDAPAAESIWSERERKAWAIPPRISPSEWATKYFRIHRGARKGPYRHENAPYLRGVMDIALTPGVVQWNFRAPGQVGKSTLLRILMAYVAHVRPAPVGLTLPNRDKGRQISKNDVLPMFRRTPILRELVGNPAKDLLIESVRLLNGFELDVMWSGSAAAMASNPYQIVINDEVDKYEPWRGDDTDAITSTEGRITSYGDERLQANTSTPTTIAGTIHRLYEHSTVQLEYCCPCPHCGHMQPLVWKHLKYMDHQCAVASLQAATAAAAGGATAYAIGWNEGEKRWAPCGLTDEGASPVSFETAAALAAHAQWLAALEARLALVEGRRDLADVLAAHRDQAVWYQCRQCCGRIYHRQKAPMVRLGRWRSPAGPVVDALGVEHDDAEDVTQWPPETRIGATMTALPCLWQHWGTLVSQWLGAQSDPAALFFFVTFRLGEPFEFKTHRLAEGVFAAKCARAALPAEIVPAWAWTLLATIDTQPDHFYVVVRAWGGSMRSARVWHGKVLTFDELDRLIFAKQWPVEGGSLPPMVIARALIDSGGTLDKLMEASRTVQVYQYAIPRQPIVTAIKGSDRKGIELYWPMRNPMSEGGGKDLSSLRALMLNPHRANDLLSEMIATGTPGLARPGEPAGTAEQWLLNRNNDPTYNAHMGAVQRTVDPKTKAEVWRPKSTAARHDYRDCEAYQVVAAYAAHVHLLPAFDEVATWQRAQQQQTPPARPAGTAAGGEDAWTPTPL